ncbi:RluA family pseudouridine synthase [Verrucomicrobiaceae bacterium N1E253]|uniref:RluA family pseudouridine synthase n=1 Tax=Oceaniferula marina TaxID=2748318 RepID=A0A851GDZ6_9BACT|nr:RluA family pseudouridine synthase [Oceaniferula marina]NWK55773.1 RluA family pseudouridine synthase [Oceaniferula marina]
MNPNPPLLEILHTDPCFVVVNKQSGMLAVPGRGPEKIDSVAHRVKLMFPGCIEQPAVHRLDMDTSGLMVVARTAEAHRHLSRQFHERQTSKRYIALLDGLLADSLGAEGSIELPFRLDVDNRPIQIYDEVHGKMGTTHWSILGVESGRTRVSFTPVTGRTHQLRLHASHAKGLGVPIVGDPFYGHGTGPGQLLLHACELGFTHPDTGESLHFRSAPAF